MLDWKKYQKQFEEDVAEPMHWLKTEFSKLRVGRASPTILDDVKVEVYGEHMSINQVANVSVPDPRTLLIKPYDKQTVKEIVAGINAANLGINPQVDADAIRLTFQAPTEDARKQLVKKAKALAEETKVKIRRVRQDLADEFKKDEATVEDDKKYFQTQLDEITKQQNKKVDDLLSQAETEIMKI